MFSKAHFFPVKYASFVPSAIENVRTHLHASLCFVCGMLKRKTGFRQPFSMQRNGKEQRSVRGGGEGGGGLLTAAFVNSLRIKSSTCRNVGPKGLPWGTVGYEYLSVSVCLSLCVWRVCQFVCVCVYDRAVSYTHLTLPTRMVV